MSYQEQFAQSLKSRYGGKVAMYESLRSPTVVNVFLDAAIEDNYRKGEEAVVVMLLLSRCDTLLKPHSALSETAIYFNPALHAHSQEMGYAHPPADCPKPTEAKVLHSGAWTACEQLTPTPCCTHTNSLLYRPVLTFTKRCLLQSQQRSPVPRRSRPTLQTRRQ